MLDSSPSWPFADCVVLVLANSIKDDYRINFTHMGKNFVDQKYTYKVMIFPVLSYFLILFLVKHI